jgi:hypothetical protein
LCHGPFSPSKPPGNFNAATNRANVNRCCRNSTKAGDAALAVAVACWSRSHKSTVRAISNNNSSS